MLTVTASTLRATSNILRATAWRGSIEHQARYSSVLHGQRGMLATFSQFHASRNLPNFYTNRISEVSSLYSETVGDKAMAESPIWDPSTMAEAQEAIEVGDDPWAEAEEQEAVDQIVTMDQGVTMGAAILHADDPWAKAAEEDAGEI